MEVTLDARDVLLACDFDLDLRAHAG
jgi:hypothetical protein